ncbi:MAG: divergent polysaccharide deacetylase family protein [Deltaproteobacteria bacterium]|nr:divergent polysaccharide deacetylase family protein [Deltaproteobacteria bacterium]MBI3755822.1 divergent polysaccharide deacetylase family protein [Deltaproteobacteria bacterium]
MGATKNKKGKRRPLFSKAFFIFGVALIFFIIIGGFILYFRQAIKEGKHENIPSAPQVAKIEKPQAMPLKPHIPKAQVAIVIDDMGRDTKMLKEILEINAPIAVAVLPFLPHSRDVAKEANLMGLDVLLHLPMEPKDLSSNDPGEGAIFTNMSEAQVASQVKKDVDAVPYITGINNHMGSKFTEDEKLMRAVLEIAKKENLFFLDSKTTNKSAAYRLAKDMGLKTATRQIFLDNKEDIAYIKGQIGNLIRVAKKRGSAIAIGHPYPATIAAIKDMMSRLNEDVEIVPVSSLIDSVNE